MEWSVRESTPEMGSGVRAVARESWHAAYDPIIGPETVQEHVDEWYSVAELEASIAEAADREDAVFLVAIDDSDAVVGFAQAGPHPERPDVAALYRIYVHPDWWGEGIGTALLERLERVLADAFDRLWLAVLADNEVGVSFYESTGFERVGRQDSDLASSVEEYVYEKRL